METAISECKTAKHTVPELPQKLEEIIAVTEEMRTVDYTNMIEKLSENEVALEDSIRRYSLVNAPSETYVIECLKKVPNILLIKNITSLEFSVGTFLILEIVSLLPVFISIPLFIIEFSVSDEISLPI